MDTSLQLILICGIIIVAYLIDLFARRTRIPAVLFLIALGVLIRQISDRFALINFDFTTIIPVIGTFGLIMIVFEGALELDYQKQKNRMIRNAFLASITILIATAAGITAMFMSLTDQALHTALVNAIPLSIISSAIAIPSVVQMTKKTREFVTYESTFSDILGIILFNYVITYSALNGEVFLKLGAELILVALLSLVVCLLLLFLLKNISHQVKFILIIAVMVLMFAIGKYFEYVDFGKDFHLLHQITAEGVFLIKTFFFVIFGFIIDFSELLNRDTLITAGAVTAAIYLIRAPFIRVITGHFLPETFISPRGLITILLYLSIPAEHAIRQIGAGVLFLVVLITSFMMLLGRKERPDHSP